MRQPGKGQVATAKITDGRIDRLRAEEKIELCMKRMPKEELYDDFFCLNLRREPAKTRFVVVCRYAEGKLFSKLFCHPSLEPQRCLVVDSLFLFGQPQRLMEFIVRHPLHAHKQAAAVTVAAGPLLAVGDKL